MKNPKLTFKLSLNIFALCGLLLVLFPKLIDFPNGFPLGIFMGFIFATIIWSGIQLDEEKKRRKK